MPDCPNCDESLDDTTFPFGDTVECPQCHAMLETDWDYIDDDSMLWWVTGVKGKE